MFHQGSSVKSQCSQETMQFLENLIHETAICSYLSLGTSQHSNLAHLGHRCCKFWSEWRIMLFHFIHDMSALKSCQQRVIWYKEALPVKNILEIFSVPFIDYCALVHLDHCRCVTERTLSLQRPGECLAECWISGFSRGKVVQAALNGPAVCYTNGVRPCTLCENPIVTLCSTVDDKSALEFRNQHILCSWSVRERQH